MCIAIVQNDRTESGIFHFAGRQEEINYTRPSLSHSLKEANFLSLIGINIYVKLKEIFLGN